MWLKCTEQDRISLLNFLNREPINNTFFISDIDHYGFDKDYQDAYMMIDEKGACHFAYLIFHNVLILAGNSEFLHRDTLQALPLENIDVIMGKDSLIRHLSNQLKADYHYTRKMIYKLVNDRSLPIEHLQAVKAEACDAADIYGFLNAVPEFKGMYASQAMITNRIKGTEGTHIFYKDKDAIIAHGNTAANTAGSCFIGGVATAEAYQHQGYATRIVAQLAREALNAGRYPCLMNAPEEKGNLFDALGFREHGRWGTLRRK